MPPGNTLSCMNKFLRMARYGLYHRLYISPKSERELVDRFHRLYYDAANFGKTWKDTRWMGVPTWKCPLDLWIYQEMLFELKPDLIIETGTFNGGSAHFMASLCDILNKGRIISIDVQDRAGRPTHKRVEYWLSSSTAPEIVERVRKQIQPGNTVLVFLDSDHRRDHVLAEMRAYAPMVTPGSYMVVEDSNLNGHPVHPEFGPGPMEALDAFLVENRDFEIDESREKFFLTFNPRGYLRKKQTG